MKWTSEPEEHDEIEITKEMIEAGVRELWGYSPEAGMQEDCVEDIYRAMVKAKGRARALTARPV